MSIQGILPDLPLDIAQEITGYLNFKDLISCARVSKAWKIVFDLDRIWEPIAKKLNVKKVEFGIYFKSLVHKYLLEIINNYPREFLTIFGVAQTIQSLPEIAITPYTDSNTLRSSYCFPDTLFSAPVVRATVTAKDNSKSHFILLRVKNNETGEVYRDAITIYSFSGGRHFLTDRTRSKQRIIAPRYTDVTNERLDRLQRLIRNEPVGVITREDPSYIIEGPTRTSDGKSVLELF